MQDHLRKATWRWTAAAALPAVPLAAWQSVFAYPFFSDDSFISLRYSERLLAGHGLTWTDVAGVPERVEGYSNLLWVLLTAALGALGIDLVTAARMLGAITTVFALWCLAGALRPRDVKSTVVASVAPLLVASSQPVMIWTLGGLEGPLLLALLALGFGGLVRRHAPLAVATNSQIASDNPWSARTLLLLGIPFAFACWTRPDGPLWALTAGVGIASLSLGEGLKRGCMRAFWFGLPAVLAVLAQLSFRLLYYGDYVPNTAHVKAELDPAALPAGAAFVGNAMRQMPGLATAATVGCLLMLLHRRTRAFATVLFLPVLAWLSYLAVIGGDHFPGLRLLHGVLVPLALLAAVGLGALRTAWLRVLLASVAAIAASSWNIYAARTDARSLEARGEVWEWHAKVLGETLGRAFDKRQPRIAVDAAGALPFYSKLPALDMLGLCDRTIATTPFPQWLDTMRPGIPKPPGHMRGNGMYVLEQQPDMLLFQHAPGLPLPVFVSACEMEDDPRFLDNYRCVLLDLGKPEILPGRPEPHLAPLWIRVTGRAGINATVASIRIPAYLFGSFQAKGAAIHRHQPATGNPAVDLQHLANLNAMGQFWAQRQPVAIATTEGPLALRLLAGQAASLSCSLPAGRFQIRMTPASCKATVRLVGSATGQASTGETATMQAAELASGVLTVPSDRTVTLELAASSDHAAHPTAIVLDRTR